MGAVRPALCQVAVGFATEVGRQAGANGFALDLDAYCLPQAHEYIHLKLYFSRPKQAPKERNTP